MWTPQRKSEFWSAWIRSGGGGRAQKRLAAASEYPLLGLLLAEPAPTVDVDRGIGADTILRRHYSFSPHHLRAVQGRLDGGLLTPDIAPTVAALPATVMPRTEQEVGELERLLGGWWQPLAISILNHPDHLRRQPNSDPVFRVQGFRYDSRRHLSMALATRELAWLAREPLEAARRHAPTERAWNYFAHASCYGLPPLQVTGTAIQLRVEAERAALGKEHRTALEVLITRLPVHYRNSDPSQVLQMIEGDLESGVIKPFWTASMLTAALSRERLKSVRSSTEPEAEEDEFLLM